MARNNHSMTSQALLLNLVPVECHGSVEHHEAHLHHSILEHLLYFVGGDVLQEAEG